MAVVCCDVVCFFVCEANGRIVRLKLGLYGWFGEKVAVVCSDIVYFFACVGKAVLSFKIAKGLL